MMIRIVNHWSLYDLLERVRSVPLKKLGADGQPIFPYRNALLSLRELHPDEVNPPTFYALRQNLQVQRDLRAALLEQGHDSLHLDGALELEDDQGERRMLFPPVIELTLRTVRYVPQEGEIVHQRAVTVLLPVVNDGVHRLLLARELGETFRALHVVGADPHYPYYAHPNAWSDVQIMDRVPATQGDKKMYSRLDCTALYRDFAVFGCGGIRPPGST